VEQRGVLLIGGGARSDAVRQLAPGIFGGPVTVPEPEEYVALGAARQAAWALAGTPDPPGWPAGPPPSTPGRPCPTSATGSPNSGTPPPRGQKGPMNRERP
jgi:xylulokinase